MAKWGKLGSLLLTFSPIDFAYLSGSVGIMLSMKSTPNTDRGRASLRSIIEAAARLFYRHGVHATGLNQIADVSGTGKGQIYHFFKDKDELILAVIAAQISRTLTMDDAYFSAMKTIDDLYAWADHCVRRFEENEGLVRCPVGSLVVELANENPLFRAALDDGFVRWRAAITGGLNGLMTTGTLPPNADLDRIAEVLLAAYEGGIVLSEVHGNTNSLKLAMYASIEWITAQAVSQH